MRPLKLSMSAFGPFVGTEVIDFTCLGDNPLFLLNGPTGAGKTSILDAICFALYGKTTGDEREGGQMRCDMSDDQLLTEVTFDFSLAKDQYQIRRVPEQSRVKKSGEGFTIQKPEAQLYKIETDGTQTILVSSKVSNANEHIEQLTGLDADQFRQVMVLPQGKFRQLLMADSKEREKIFSQLFQTHIYRKIEDKLKQQALGIKASVKEHENRIEGVLHNAQVDSINSLITELESLDAPYKKAQLDKIKAHENFVLVSQVFEKGQSILKSFDELNNLKENEVELVERKSVIVQQKDRLLMSDKASKVLPFLNALKERDVQFTKAKQQTKQTEVSESGCKVKLEHAAKQNLTLTSLDNTLSEDLNTLQQYVALRPQIEQLAKLKLALEAQEREVKTSSLKEVEIIKEQEALRTQQAIMESQIPVLQNLSEQQLPVQQALARLENILSIYSQWQNATVQAQDTAQLLSQAALDGKTLKESFDALRLKSQETQMIWHQGQAALLAGQLSHGSPCLVCGSAQHPNPAQSLQVLPTQQEVQALQQQESYAYGLVEKAREYYKGLSLKHKEQIIIGEELKVSLGGQALLSLEALQLQFKNTQQALIEASLAHKKLQSLRDTVQTSQQQQQQLHEQLQRLQSQLLVIKQELSSLEGQFQQTKNSIPGQYQDLPVLDLAIKQLENKIQKNKQAIQGIHEQFNLAQQNLAAASAQLVNTKQNLESYLQYQQQAHTQLNVALEEAGIENESILLESILPLDQLETLKESITQFEKKCITVNAQILQLSKQLQDVAPPNLENLQEQVAKAKTLQQQTEEAFSQLHGRFNLLTHTQSQLQEAQKKGRDLEKEYAVVGTLSDVANGHTGKKISLQRFVLSVLLDDVLVSASQRLNLMSKGRYQLLRKEDRAKGNKASGLELEVEDAYTSKVRSVATLSGGESFMAALSMALGVSDVVQAYSGGIKLDTLFIDEGFGSLDQESLDLAIRTLVDLQASGRMVGVISHVSEMKEQIGTRIDITKTSMGSHTAIVLP
ncbi:MAG: SMC family ATPase [Bermanella sp.]